MSAFGAKRTFLDDRFCPMRTSVGASLSPTDKPSLDALHLGFSRPQRCNTLVLGVGADLAGHRVKHFLLAFLLLAAPARFSKAAHHLDRCLTTNRAPGRAWARRLGLRVYPWSLGKWCVNEPTL
jgi:hypothetical protein